MENYLRKAVAEAIRKSNVTTIIGGKAYSPKELAEEVEKETEIGKKIIEMAIKGTIERYAKGKSLGR